MPVQNGTLSANKKEEVETSSLNEPVHFTSLTQSFNKELTCSKSVQFPHQKGNCTGDIAPSAKPPRGGVDED